MWYKKWMIWYIFLEKKNKVNSVVKCGKMWGEMGEVAEQGLGLTNLIIILKKEC